MNKRRRAFTLIELIVVIIILGILAALIIPRVFSRSSEAKRAKAASDIATLRNALQQFRVDTDRFPTTEEGLNALENPPANIKNWKGPYLTRQIPLDPWEHEYHYEYPGAQGDDSFLLICYGSDGAPGGTGDAEDISEGDQ